MKRIFSILLITVLLLTALPLMTTAALAETYATVTSENGYGVRLRMGPSKAYDSLGTFPVGTTVTVLQSGLEWSQIQIGSVTGYMLNQYLNYGATGNSGSGATPPTGANEKVISDNGLRVWLRSTAGGKRLFLNAAGTPVVVLDRGAEWSRVYINGSYGYMMTKYISNGSGGSTPAPEPTVSGKLTRATLNYRYPAVGDTMSVEVEPEGATVKYSWQVAGGIMSDSDTNFVEVGTEPTLNVLTRYANCNIRVIVTGTGACTGTVTAMAAEKVQISLGIKSVKLNKNGAPVVGDVLTAILQPSSANVDYTWRVGGVIVSDEPTYTVQEGDIGKLIQLKVSGLGEYVGSAACSADAPVVSDKKLLSVQISDMTPIVGQKLTGTLYPAGAAAKWTWTADDEVVATGDSYTPTALDLGRKITLTCVGTAPYSGTVHSTTANVANAELKSVSINNMNPMVGDRLIASLTPANATANFEWFVHDSTTPVGTGSSFQIPVSGYEGKKIYVQATGTGVYTSQINQDGKAVDSFVQSPTTEAVKKRVKAIDSIVIDNANPVVGEKLTVTLKPSDANSKKSDPAWFTYVWYAGTEVRMGEHGPTYEVQPIDAGKKLRVEVKGAKDFEGATKYSAFTNEVKTEGKLSGFGIKNKTTGANAVSTLPQVSDVLEVAVTPSTATDQFDYTWVSPTGTATGTTYKVQAGDVGGYIKVTAKPNATTNYKENKTAQTAKVVGAKKFVSEITIPAPVAGQSPVTSASKDKKYKATIQWEQDNGTTWIPAAFDKRGHFEPGTIYRAKITVTVLDGSSLYYETGSGDPEVKLTVRPIDQKAEQKSGSNVFYQKFGATGKQDVTDYYITGIPKPTADTEIGVVVTVDKFNDQLKGKYTWARTGDDWTCTIDIEAIDPAKYELTNVPANVFTVSGAEYATYGQGGTEVKAYFKLLISLSIQADKTQVPVDRLNARIVQCNAVAENWNGEITNEKWEIVTARNDGTNINSNGTLVIDAEEEPERDLVIKLTAEIDGKTFEATKTIELLSGVDQNTEIMPYFVRCQRTVKVGEEATFTAKVSNSLLGCHIFALDSNGDPLPAVVSSDGLLTIKPGYSWPKQFVVKVVSDQNHEKEISMLVTLEDEVEEKIYFKKLPSKIKQNEDVYIEAVHWDGEQEYPCTYKADTDVLGNYIDVPGGKLNVSPSRTGTLTVRATTTKTGSARNIEKTIEITTDETVMLPPTILMSVFRPLEIIEGLPEGELEGEGETLKKLEVIEGIEGIEGMGKGEGAEEGEGAGEGEGAKEGEGAGEGEGANEGEGLIGSIEGGLKLGEVKLGGLKMAKSLLPVGGENSEGEGEVTDDGKAAEDTDNNAEETVTPDSDEEDIDDVVIAVKKTVMVPRVAIAGEIDKTEVEADKVEGEPEKAEGETDKPETEPEKVEGETDKPEAEPEKVEGETDKSETEPEKAEGETDKPEAEPEKVEGESDKPETESEKVEVEVEKTETEPEKVEGEVEEPETEPEKVEGEIENVEGEIETPEGETEKPETEPEKTEDEDLESGVIIIKKTGTDEIIDQSTFQEAAEEAKESQSKKNGKAKGGKKAKDNDEEAQDIEEPDELLDSAEGDDLGKSVDNALNIKISFLKKIDSLKAGNSFTFSAQVDGSDKNVVWSVRRSKNADGLRVSTIGADGKLTVSKDEVSDRLVVIATITEGDTVVRVRWNVAITPSNGKGSSGGKKDEASDEAKQTETNDKAPANADVPASGSEKPDSTPESSEPENTGKEKGFTQEQIDQINKELKELEEQYKLIDNVF